MQNHKDIPLIYDCAEVLDALQVYAIPEDNGADVSGCSITEIEKISKVLNLGLPIKSILYFRMGRDFKGYIHKDINLNTPHLFVNHALNLPLQNCQQVYMNWFTQNDSNIDITSFGGPTTGSPTPLLDSDNATCIDTVNCNTATLVSVNDWHSIDNYSIENCAYLISIRFMPNVKPSMILPMNEWLTS